MSSGGILAAVKEKAHYAITLRPRSIKNFSLGELEKMASDCAVRCRGFPYPYVSNGKMRRMEKCIEGSHEWGMHVDVWRFYKSGQFKEYIGLYEARWPATESGSFRFGTPLRERFLEPIVTLYQISEVFLFASRLASKIPELWRIEIKLCDMQDRMLDIRVPDRYGLYTDYKCNVPAITLSAKIDSESLQLRYADLAVDKTLEIMDCFGWNEESLKRTLREEQERLYMRGETRAMPAPTGREQGR